eukprot:366346-Chlamydomonas_euryale.AAC.8
MVDQNLHPWMRVGEAHDGKRIPLLVNPVPPLAPINHPGGLGGAPGVGPGLGERLGEARLGRAAGRKRRHSPFRYFFFDSSVTSLSCASASACAAMPADATPKYRSGGSSSGVPFS